MAPLVVGRRGWFYFGLPWWQGAAILLLIAWLYGSILARLFGQWINDPDFSHGIFVPAFSLFVLWLNRKRLSSFEPVPSWSGLGVLVCALLMLMLGVLGAELFFSRLSLLVLLAGLIVLFSGWPLFRAGLFPWAFLILMIPIPKIIFQQVTFPLQLLASKLSAELLPIAGVPVLREGNVIYLPSMPLEVAQACSGIRSLLSLVTLAIIYGYLMETRKWVRVALACSAVPIAVAANSFRIFGTGLLVQYWDPDKAKGFYHEFSGWLIFVVSMIMLFTLHRVISLIWKDRPEAKSASSGTPGKPGTATGPAVTPARSWSLRFWIAAVLMLAAGIALQAHPKGESFPHREALNSLPSQFGPWAGRDVSIDQETLDILGAGEFLVRDYENASASQPGIDLFIAYFPTQKAGDTIHSPSNCLPGAGWVPTHRKVVRIPRGDGTSFPANQYVVAKAGERQLVLYWYLAHDRVVTSEYWAKYYLVADSIRLNRSDGALIRLTTPMFRGESPDAAQARILGLGSYIIPILNHYIPR
ncbi:MAG: VPLPA-CTERM-specific exosortase XrtD [Terriglobales bacterium]